MAYLLSDNTAAVHPEIMAALAAANEGHARPYGGDDLTARLTTRLREVFEHEALLAFPVFNGSASNCAALMSLVRPYESVIAHAHSHLEQSECGMPEFFTGGKVLLAEGEAGKIDPAAVAALLQLVGGKGANYPRPAALSLSQVTEAGTVYRPHEIQRLSALSKEHGLHFHMDGARLANAVAHLNCAPADITWKAGVDVLSFGGTKNGALLAEAVVFFTPGLAADFIYIRKRAGQLASKQRYLSAQLLALLDNDLWLKNAAHANAMGNLLRKGLSALGLLYDLPTEANLTFAAFPPSLAAALHRHGHLFHPWPLFGENVYRLVTSFATTPQEIETFLTHCAAG